MIPYRPLRYNISSWDQLPGCLSNNSRDLSLHVLHLVNNRLVEGKLIELKHVHFGTLFACLVEGSGPLLTENGVNGPCELSTDAILNELAKFGFLITFEKQDHLDGDQLQFLMSLRTLGMDKIRIIVVKDMHVDGQVSDRPVVVGFNITQNPQWLNNWYSPTEKEFHESINNGSAINISGMCKEQKFNWDWLTYIARIDDILRENSRVR